jgi:hypothetical protein
MNDAKSSTVFPLSFRRHKRVLITHSGALYTEPQSEKMTAKGERRSGDLFVANAVTSIPVEAYPRLSVDMVANDGAVDVSTDALAKTYSAKIKLCDGIDRQTIGALENNLTAGEWRIIFVPDEAAVSSH